MATRTSSGRKKPLALPPGVRLTHPDRVVYAEQGITKQDLALYYVAVADRMLPHIVGRPISIVRCPTGMRGDCFYQKHPPVGISEQLERLDVREKRGMATYLVIRDLEGLLGLVQFGVLEIHVWGALAEQIERPDRIIFDLDPDPTVPWKDVKDAAWDLKELLEKLELTSFLKTTGGKGLHIVVPIKAEWDWETVKPFCRAVAEMMTRMNPERYLANMSKAARRGKIFVDYLRNDRGATSVGAYSTRARPVAPVSMPISWRELNRLTGPATYTVVNVPDKVSGRRADPWLDLLSTRQSLSRTALKALKVR